MNKGTHKRKLITGVLSQGKVLLEQSSVRAPEAMANEFRTNPASMETERAGREFRTRLDSAKPSSSGVVFDDENDCSVKDELRCGPSEWDAVIAEATHCNRKKRGRRSEHSCNRGVDDDGPSIRSAMSLTTDDAMSHRHLQDGEKSVNSSGSSTRTTDGDGSIVTTNTIRSATSSISIASITKGEEYVANNLRHTRGILPPLDPHRATKPTTGGATKTSTSRIRTAPHHVQKAVEEMDRWLFVEGGTFEDVEALMTRYSQHVRRCYGLPLDRLYCGIGLHPKLTAHLWRWEANEFHHREMPPNVFERRNELFSPDEPFLVLEQGRAEFVRIKDTDGHIPPQTEIWFREGKYKDYLALPYTHKGICKGGLAWSTKCPNGFSDDDIQFIELTHPTLTTILALLANDLVLTTLTDRMEKEIEDRTTELTKANDRLGQANAQISQHSAKQLECFACMSHEIRTPLNCIVGLSSLLMESNEMKESDSMRMIHSSAELLMGVVNDVLDYSKLESGNYAVDIQPTDLQSTLESVVHSCESVLERGVTIRVSYCGILPRIIETDHRSLQQILSNLLGNAGKFSRDGTSIDFNVNVVEESSHNKLRFIVRDSGKGIAKSDYESIFMPFSQASKDSQTVHGGTGLGLSITKKLVEKLGGTVGVDSRLGEYAKFTVELPFRGKIIDRKYFQEKLADTTIVVLDPGNPGGTAPMQDEYIPFCPSVVKTFGLSVLRSPNWMDLEIKLRSPSPEQHHFVIIVQEELQKHDSARERIEGLIGEKSCTWFTFGSGKCSDRRHFKSLTRVFPSVLLGTLCDEVDIERAKRAACVGGGRSRGGSHNDDDKLSSASLAPHVGHQENSRSNEHGSPNIPGRMCSDGQSTTMTSLRKEATLNTDHLTGVTNPSPVPAGRKPPTINLPRNLRVLYAEDNKVNQKVLARILTRLGVSAIDIADNGLDAVRKAEDQEYDCIFMDMEMPVMDGLEACTEIIRRNARARVVFVTAHALSGFKEKAIAAGAIDFVPKPVNLQQIDSILQRVEGLGQ
jgi:signal transduction histidine kinase/CheY-like chemotaxis protein